MTRIVLDDSQERACRLILEARVGVVTGGPGTGKTTILREALDRIDRRSDVTGSGARDTRIEGDWFPYELASPTGKAAKRMAEATNREALTIHRLLGWTGSGWRHTADNPLETDLVVIDEASMVDVRLAAALMRAIDFDRTRLILVGDANQLPSVGPGDVLGDAIRSGAVPVARLDTVHRAAAKSWVCTAAPLVLRGKVPDLADVADFRYHEADTAADVTKRAVDLFTSGALPPGSQLLTPQRTGAAGIDAMNGALQHALNPGGEAVLQNKRRAQELRLGDRVIQRKNNYSLNVFNGDVGEVVAKTDAGIRVAFEDGRSVDFDRAQAANLHLAYALTIHSSQGSEWPWVVVVCHSTHTRMLNRALLYTAITRAKKGVVVIGNEGGWRAALREKTAGKRNTTIADRLRAGRNAA